jgi:thymidylate synthase (FAD)
MKVELIAITPNCEKVIEEAGRTCYLSLDKITEGSHESFIQAAIRRGHESIIEHASATFRVSGVSRALSHQLVRHRIASYSQQSQRWVNEDMFEYVTPVSILDHTEDNVQEVYKNIMKQIQDGYKYLRDHGIPKEDARFVLPNATHTEIVLTMNFRAMRNFFRLRLDKHAQWEIRDMAGRMLKIVKQGAPNVFLDFKIEEE